ncbi:MAG: PTS sugar transporter subunit IIA [Planctomycetes bacterium]|nr:PTS sugar transporter subunit IIA [Planctomycetota bacterium]
MQLSVRELATALKVSERAIYQWIKQGSLRAHQVNGQHRFNRSELVEWATAQRRDLPPELLHNGDDDGLVAGIPEAIEAGGIFRNISGDDKEAVLRAMVNTIRLPDGTDRELLFRVLLAREALGSTGIGDGLAIPHPRNPIVLNVERPMVAVCLLAKPAEFGSLDGQPVHTLFSLISPTVRDHLHLLSRLAYALKDSAFNAAIVHRKADKDILKAARRMEANLKRPLDQTAGRPRR